MASSARKLLLLFISCILSKDVICAPSQNSEVIKNKEEGVTEGVEPVHYSEENHSPTHDVIEEQKPEVSGVYHAYPMFGLTDQTEGVVYTSKGSSHPLDITDSNKGEGSFDPSSAVNNPDHLIALENQHRQTQDNKDKLEMPLKDSAEDHDVTKSKMSYVNILPSNIKKETLDKLLVSLREMSSSTPKHVEEKEPTLESTVKDKDPSHIAETANINEDSMVGQHNEGIPSQHIVDKSDVEHFGGDSKIVEDDNSKLDTKEESVYLKRDASDMKFRKPEHITDSSLVTEEFRPQNYNTNSDEITNDRIAKLIEEFNVLLKLMSGTPSGGSENVEAYDIDSSFGGNNNNKYFEDSLTKHYGVDSTSPVEESETVA